MLITMSDRGPDSAGVAIYGEPANTESKITIQSDKQNNDFETLESISREKLDERLDISFKDTHAVIRAHNTKIKFILELIENYLPRTRVMSVGSSIEIYKEKLITIDGEPSIELVEKDALEMLSKVIQA